MNINNWKMDFMEHRALDCTVPCDTYGVLLNHGLIDDPYYGTNEIELCELSRHDCTFYTEVLLSKDELLREHIELAFYGLDTICDIYLNGTLLDSVKNMHRKYEYDIKALARAKNEIRLEFKAPIPYFEEKEAEHHLYTNCDSIQGASHLRKALYMSGWDWAPQLPNMGIFRRVELLCYNGDLLSDTEIVQHHESGAVKVELFAKTKHQVSDLSIICELDGKKIELSNGYGELEISNPRLWWPNGYGAQELYEVKFYLYNGSELLDTVSKSIGLRTLMLSQEKDEQGSEFCFKVNGIKIFAMGANYVPVDMMPSKITRERLEEIIKDCVFANFNSVRVWGGAFYPCDYFYDLCDRYGLIVWQDFMVACANVWLTPDMENEFTKEAIYNVKRIRHHACLGILCGNNEMEEAICGWECADGFDPLVRSDYLKLYENILPKICAEHAPYIAYTPSSPTSGGGFNSPQAYNVGDVHFWHVWNGNCGFDEYRKHKFRFCSEYGFESLPSIKTIDAFCPRDERNLLSFTMESHQKHKTGNIKILKYLVEQYQMPKDLEATVYASQLNQANAIKYGVEHFRRNRGYTMGSIYWQLNDPWPVASWSSVDYFGRYKALHYFARKFYAPVALGLFNENGSITLNVANEQMTDFEGYIIAGVKKNDLTDVYKTKTPVSVLALSSKDVCTLSSAEFDNMTNRYFYAELYDKNGNLIMTSTELGSLPKHFKFLEPNIKLSAAKVNNGIMLGLKASAFAKSVEISFKNYDLKLSDNFIDLATEKEYTVFVKTELSCEQLLKEISLFSVYDMPDGIQTKMP